jgi:hypothetical protein
MAQQPVQVTTADTISWSDGTPFNGYVALIGTLPEASSASWTRIALRDTYPALRLPTRIKLPIREGVLDESARVYKTTSIVPPQVRYSAFWYDSTDRLIAIGTLLFAVTTDPHVLTPPTLSIGDPADTSEQPEDVPSTSITTVFYGAPTREDLTGTKNGINTTFTLGAIPTVVMVLWNGQVLDEGVGYTRSGATVTMTSAPASNDTLEAVRW